MAFHECYAEGCEQRIAPSLLMCRYHWRQVPSDLQQEVYRTYRRGKPTTDYPKAARAARDSLLPTS